MQLVDKPYPKYGIPYLSLLSLTLLYMYGTSTVSPHSPLCDSPIVLAHDLASLAPCSPDRLKVTRSQYLASSQADPNLTSSALACSCHALATLPVLLHSPSKVSVSSPRSSPYDLVSQFPNNFNPSNRHTCKLQLIPPSVVLLYTTHTSRPPSARSLVVEYPCSPATVTLPLQGHTYTKHLTLAYLLPTPSWSGATGA